MSVESEILRIQHNIANAYAAVSQKGGEVPLQPTSENLSEAINTIPGSGGGPSYEIYSTEETRIGTWIDGKPLYRKCYTFTTNYNGDFTDVANVSDFFIEFASFISGTITNSINQKLQIPCLLSSGMGYFILESSMLKFYTTSTGLKGRPATCILEYTKTTDESTASTAEIVAGYLDGLPPEDLDALSEAVNKSLWED